MCFFFVHRSQLFHKTNRDNLLPIFFPPHFFNIQISNIWAVVGTFAAIIIGDINVVVDYVYILCTIQTHINMLWVPYNPHVHGIPVVHL